MDDRDGESEKVRQLTADLQITALSLIKHLRTNNLRIRVEGLVPAVYITIGEGRSSYSADSVIFRGPKADAPALAQQTAQITAQNTAQNTAQITAQTTAQVAPPAAAQLEVKESMQRTPLLACFSRLKKALAA